MAVADGSLAGDTLMIRVQRKIHQLTWWLMVPVLGFVLYLALPVASEPEPAPVKPSIEGATLP